MSTLVDALQSVLTQGIDAAKSIKLQELQVNDPTGYVRAANGQLVPVGQGQSSGVSSALASVPPVAWIGLAAVVALLVIPRLIGRG